MIRFERTHDPALIAEIIERAWDRPAMLSDGADPANVAISDSLQYFLALRETAQGTELLGLFAGAQQTNVCLEIHACLLPSCRGRSAIAALRAFLAWLADATGYRKVIGSIPAYNAPMLLVARAAGMEVLAVNRRSVMRNGLLDDQTVVEKELNAAQI